MAYQAYFVLSLLAVVRGDYNNSPPASGPGYAATPTVHSPPATPHNPSAPTHAPYTTAVVHSTPTSTTGTTMSTPYTGGSQPDTGYNYPPPYSVREPFSPIYQQFTPQFISQYYKQPPFLFSHSNQHASPSQSLNPPSFQPHSCASPNNPQFQPHQPYLQSALFQVANPLSFLNGLASSPNSFHPLGPRGPLPSPGYYSPNPAASSQPLFSVGYTPPPNHPLPYSVH